MDKLTAVMAIEELRDRLFQEMQVTPKEKTKAEQAATIKMLMQFYNLGHIQKTIDDLRTEIEADNLTVTKGSRAKQRMTAIKNFATKCEKKFATTRPIFAGICRDSKTGKDVIMENYYGIMLNDKAPECAVKSKLYDKDTSNFSSYYDESRIKSRFNLSSKAIEGILKERKAVAGRSWSSDYCADRIVVFGTEDKSVQFKVDIQLLCNAVKCIENDDRSFELCFTSKKSVLIINTEHGIGLVMPFVKRQETDETLENDYILLT